MIVVIVVFLFAIASLALAAWTGLLLRRKRRDF